MIKETTMKAAVSVLGHTKHKHRDWFDDQDPDIRVLLDNMHEKHLDWINNKNDMGKKSVYCRAKNGVQYRLRQMKDCWWQNKASELQAAGDKHDMKSFYHGLRTVYYSNDQGSTHIQATDGRVLSEKADILQRWAEHFNSVLNQPSQFDDSVLSELPMWPTASELNVEPSTEEVLRALHQTSSGKAPGIDGIPPDILKLGGDHLLSHLAALFHSIWTSGVVPQDFKDALIVHIYKRKGDRSSCDNHLGITLILRRIGCPDKFVHIIE